MTRTVSVAKHQLVVVGGYQMVDQKKLSRARLRNGDVINMLQSLPLEIVIAKVKAGPCHFDTLPDTLKQLKLNGVPDAVILAMVKAS